MKSNEINWKNIFPTPNNYIRGKVNNGKFNSFAHALLTFPSGEMSRLSLTM